MNRYISFVGCISLMTERSISRYFLVLALFSGLYSCVYAEGNFDWIDDHIVVRTTENVTLGQNGDVQKIEKIQNSQVIIKQVLTERQEKDKHGIMRVVLLERITDITDTDKCVTRIIEKDTGNGTGFNVTFISRNRKTTSGSESTVETLDKDGVLKLVKRVIVSSGDDGSTKTVTEVRDQHGRMVVQDSTSQF